MIDVIYMLGEDSLLQVRAPPTLPNARDYVVLNIGDISYTYQVSHLIHVNRVSGNISIVDVYIYLKEADLPPV